MTTSLDTGGAADPRTDLPERGLSRRPWPPWALESRLYVAAAAVCTVAVTLMTRLWRANWSIPFGYGGDGTSSAGYFKTVLDTGWYETQPNLGYPYGQHYHDFPFSDDLHPMVIKFLGLFTRSWEIVFNAYYILGFPLAALTAVWFLRRCGLTGWLSVVLAVLFAVAPYHFIRNQGHYFLGEYYPVPLGLVVVLSVIRGERIWGLRQVRGRFREIPVLRRVVPVLTGRGAGTLVCLALVTLDGAYYAVFTATLLAAAGLLALARTRNWRRFGGAVVAGATLGAVFILAMLPDIVYEHIHGSDGAAFVRERYQAERYALKFAELIMPAAGYPIPALARFRLDYNNNYPYPGENPALGTMASIGFLLLLGVVLLVLIGRWSRGSDPVRIRRARTMYFLGVLTLVAFMAGTIGGLGSVLSFVTAGIRGWNRISIFIMLFALAGLGLAVEGGVQRLAVRRRGGAVGGAVPRLARFRLTVPVAALSILLLGLADQSLTRAIPSYAGVASSFRSDGVFVRKLESMVPAGSPVFQMPYIAFPEGAPVHMQTYSDQLRLWLQSTTLRWSGGGMKGRPQTDWPGTVVMEPPARLTRDLAIVGFVGIVIDTRGTADRGRALEAALAPYTGPVVFVSPDRRWAYLSLSKPVADVTATMTEAQRTAAAASIVHAAG